MELTQLKYFMEVAASQHITKSAEKLHIAQPALTQAIQTTRALSAARNSRARSVSTIRVPSRS